MSQPQSPSPEATHSAVAFPSAVASPSAGASPAIPAGAPDRSRIKSYGRKKGFLRPQEVTWLEETLPAWDVPPARDRDALLQALGADPATARLWLEVGFGNGDFLLAQASRHPGDRFIAVEVFWEGIAAAIKKLQGAGCGNARVVRDNVYLLLGERIPPASLDRVVVNFPDPWPKKRHHKRRLIQARFLDLLATRMVPGGVLTLATDWENYAEGMVAACEAHPALHNLHGPGVYAPEPEGWVRTRFEEKGRRAGRAIRHLAYRRE